MTEPGWPLIPRELLPPPVPVPVAKRSGRRGGGGRRPGHQLPMFGAETTEPSPADLAGLLAGPGHLGRMGGTARVAVRVDAAWRVHVLVQELHARGLAATWAPIDPDRVRGEQPATEPEEPEQPAAGAEPGEEASPDDEPGGEPGDESSGEPDDEPGGEPDDEPEQGDEPLPEPARQLFEVRTAYSRRLNALADAWPRAAARLFLSGPRLRLWVAAAGAPRHGGYALGLDPAKDPQPVEGALVRAGLQGRLSDDGRVYLVTGRRRVTRLAELVGERPSAAPEELWPGGAPA